MNFLWDRIQHYSEQSPHRLALIEPCSCALSFAQLHATLESVAGALREAGIGSADRVAVILLDGACGLLSMLGAARLCACAPLNPDLTAAELEADLVALRASAVILSRELEVPMGAAARLGLPAIEAESVGGGFRWRTMRTRSSPVAHYAGDSDAARLLLFTSATTGRRKLVPLSSENIEAQVGNSASSLRLGCEDRLLMLARSFHIMGILSPLAQLLAGGSVLITHGFTPQTLPKWLSEFEPTWYTCGPTLHRAILSYLEEHPLPRATSLRFVRSGGAPLDPGLRTRLESALHVPVLNVYGLSETGGVASTTPEICATEAYRAAQNAVGASVGPAIATMDAEGRLLPLGMEGEIVVSGPNVMAGYLDDPAANRDAFVGAWFRTGDLGHLDERGWLHVTGRLKEIVNRGGQKIIPNEVDAAVAEHPAVLEAAAFGIPHPSLGEDIACAVVLRPGQTADEVGLRAFAARRLAAFKVPRRIYLIDALPRGATGKPQRLVLRARFSVVAATPQAPAGRRLQAGMGLPRLRPIDLDESLAGLWCKHSQSRIATLDQDFFSAGGDSLSAVMMLSEAEDLFCLDVVLSSSTFFQEPTFATLSRMVAEAVDGRSDLASSAIEVVPLRKGAGTLSLFMIPSDGEEGCGFRRLARALDADWPMALVRPGNCWYDRARSSLETEARQAVEAILKSQPDGPYLLAGYCYGGVVAYEAARLLEARGADVRLVLFDAPVPGYPHFIADAGLYARAAADALRRAWATRGIFPLVHFAGRTIRRASWVALRAAGAHQAGVWSVPPLRWLCAQARTKYFSFYRPRPLAAPVLHFLARQECDLLPAHSRLGWRKLGLCSVTETWVDCAHSHLLDESQIPTVSTAIASFAARHADAVAAPAPAR